ncbi:MAG: branched-chain amino acid ABC transporter permease [Georgenia sp.]
MTGLLQVLTSSIVTGTAYAALLAGLLVVYQVSRAVSFAHGALGMLAAFLSYVLHAQHGLPLPLAISIGLAAAAVLSLATYRLVLEPVARRTDGEGLDLILTLGVMLLLVASAEFFLGTTTQSYPKLGTDVPTPLGPIFLNLNQLAGTIAIVAGLALLYWFLERTPVGLALRASASDPALAEGIGLNTVRIRTWTWVLAGVTAGVVGILIASRLSVSSQYMQPFLVNSMIAGMIGGFDRFVRPIVVCFLLAIFEGVVTYYVGTNYATPAVFAALIVLLAVLPKKFLAEKGTVRA